MAHALSAPGPADSVLGRKALPVRSITTGDLAAALRRGVDDFQAMPTHSLFMGAFYAVVGLLLWQVTLRAGLLQLAFPIVAGFALIGPLAALGMYELSRRRERGLDTSRRHMFAVLGSPAVRSILGLGVLLVVVFVLWLQTAHVLYNGTMGAAPESFDAFARELFGTVGGWTLMILGNAIGAAFAAFVFVITVVSFPLLLDRNVGVRAAVATSVAAVRASPRTMLLWGLVVVAASAIGSVPAFLGLALVFPILGHATWHLYRRIVPA